MTALGTIMRRPRRLREQNKNKNEKRQNPDATLKPTVTKRYQARVPFSTMAFTGSSCA